MDKHKAGTKIRDGLNDGRLPTRRPTRTWFGFAQGDTSCVACGDPIAIRALECEAEFPDESRTRLFHAACFEIWDAERVAPLTRDHDPIARDGHPIARDQHPIDRPPRVTEHVDQARAACVEDSPRDEAVPRVTRLPQTLSDRVRRAGREFISFIAPWRSARPR